MKTVLAHNHKVKVSVERQCISALGKESMLISQDSPTNPSALLTTVNELKLPRKSTNSEFMSPSEL